MGGILNNINEKTSGCQLWKELRGYEETARGRDGPRELAGDC